MSSIIYIFLYLIIKEFHTYTIHIHTQKESNIYKKTLLQTLLLKHKYNANNLLC